jgi:hypothetical protein
LKVLAVQDESTKELTIANTGKYTVHFNWSVDRPRLQKLFTIEPASGDIAPGASQKVSLTFNRDRSLKKELTLKANTSISVSILEPLTEQKEKAIAITVCIGDCMHDVLA